MEVIPLLLNVRVAAPCTADWNAMSEIDGERVKFCSGCEKRVYNLSAMGQAEAEGLLRKHEGRLCVRYYRRADGTILTTDCPVGLKALQRLTLQRRTTSFAACVMLCLGFAVFRAANIVNRTIGQVAPSVQTPATSDPSFLTGDNTEFPQVQTDDSVVGGAIMGDIFIDVKPVNDWESPSMTRGPLLQAIEKKINSETLPSHPAE